MIEETTETKVETTNNEAKADKLNANEIVETKSSAKQSLKRERDDDEKDDTNIDKQFPKKSKVTYHGNTASYSPENFHLIKLISIVSFFRYMRMESQARTQ